MSAPQPNVLLMFTDDQRHDTIGALGNPEIRTPHMDRLVREGTAFTRAHIMGGTCPAVCMPSRAMLMTGRTLFHLHGSGESIPAEHVLLGEQLTRHGCRTFGTGKWHNGSAAYARSFCDGAEIFFGGMEDHWNVPACHFDPTGRYDQRCPVVPDPYRSNEVVYKKCDHIHAGKHSSELFADATIAFLESDRTREPFFAYVSFMAPHDPRTMPREYLELYDPATLTLPPNLLPEHPFDNGELRVRDELLAPFPRTEGEMRRHIAEYYAMVSHLDAQIGRILEALRATGREENTIVILAGDNGLAIGQHGLMGKQNLYDHSVRVPLIWRGPGVPRGAQRDDLCYLSDIHPTLCDLLRLPVPTSVEGLSLAPALRGAATGRRETLYFAYRHWQRAVRDARHKLIEYAVDGQRTTQLFDLVADPFETRNLAHEPRYRETVARLRRAAAEWRDALGDAESPHGEPFWSALDF